MPELIASLTFLAIMIGLAIAGLCGRDDERDL